MSEHLDWLVDQLERWPTRVHPERTTNIEYLMKEAAKEIRLRLEDYSYLLSIANDMGYPSVLEALEALARFRGEEDTDAFAVKALHPGHNDFPDEWVDPDDAPELSSEWFERATKHPASVDRSGEAGETRSGSTEGESAVRDSGDAQTPKPSSTGAGQ